MQTFFVKKYYMLFHLKQPSLGLGYDVEYRNLLFF
jgi:hypothetical protein